MIEGFDASYWSGTVNCKAALAAGKKYGIFRVGRGKVDASTSLYGVDKNWSVNKAAAIQAGLLYGGYWRFYPEFDMKTQVERFIQNLGPLKGCLSPWLDIEDAGGLNTVALTDWTIQCANLIEQKCGRSPVIYTGKYFLDNHLQRWRLDKWQIAVAATRDNWADYGAIFHQYRLDTGSTFSTGNIDLQRFALDTFDYHKTEHELLYFFDSLGMLHGPLCVDKRLPESGTQGSQLNYIGITHTMVGYLQGTDTYFRRSDVGVESHFGVGGKYDPVWLDGALWQWMIGTGKANANVQGDAYGLSYETSDGGGNRYLEKWTPRQAESLAQANAAWCLWKNRPAQLIERARSSERGLGYHRFGIDPWRQPGDDSWSMSRGKLCPGDTRIMQFRNETIPRIRAILASLSVDTPVEEVDMQLDDVVGKRPDGTPFTVRDVFTKEYFSKGTEALQDRINELPVEMRAVVRKHCQELEATLMGLYGAPTWGDLEGKTWGELAEKRWLKLG